MFNNTPIIVNIILNNTVKYLYSFINMENTTSIWSPSYMYSII